jgi:hypothetical protein
MKNFYERDSFDDDIDKKLQQINERRKNRMKNQNKNHHDVATNHSASGEVDVAVAAVYCASNNDELDEENEGNHEYKERIERLRKEEQIKEGMRLIQETYGGRFKTKTTKETGNGGNNDYNNYNSKEAQEGKEQGWRKRKSYEGINSNNMTHQKKIKSSPIKKHQQSHDTSSSSNNNNDSINLLLSQQSNISALTQSPQQQAKKKSSSPLLSKIFKRTPSPKKRIETKKLANLNYDHDSDSSERHWDALLEERRKVRLKKQNDQSCAGSNNNIHNKDDNDNDCNYNNKSHYQYDGDNDDDKEDCGDNDNEGDGLILKSTKTRTISPKSNFMKSQKTRAKVHSSSSSSSYNNNHHNTSTTTTTPDEGTIHNTYKDDNPDNIDNQSDDINDDDDDNDDDDKSIEQPQLDPDDDDYLFEWAAYKEQVKHRKKRRQQPQKRKHQQYQTHEQIQKPRQRRFKHDEQILNHIKVCKYASLNGNNLKKVPPSNSGNDRDDLWDDTDEDEKAATSEKLTKKNDSNNKNKSKSSRTGRKGKITTSRKKQEDILYSNDFKDCDDDEEEGNDCYDEQMESKLIPEFENPKWCMSELEPLSLQQKLSDDNGNSIFDEVPGSINRYLPDYQKKGVEFMHSIITQNKGAILGDDMGLGKTGKSLS